jgi:hypothetical protein
VTLSPFLPVIQIILVVFDLLDCFLAILTAARGTLPIHIYFRLAVFTVPAVRVLT